MRRIPAKYVPEVDLIFVFKNDFDHYHDFKTMKDMMRDIQFEYSPSVEEKKEMVNFLLARLQEIKKELEG